MIVVISGKMYAGKDTIADKLFINGQNFTHHTYSDILRPVMTTVLECVKASRSQSEAIQWLTERTSIPTQHLPEVVTIVRDALIRDLDLSATERTADNRMILQKLGSTWLPHESWLPEEMMKVAQAEQEQGLNTAIVGGRYPVDVEIPRKHGASIIRLDITRETQLRRMKNRDGISPTPESLKALEHPGESALDDWDFDLTVPNNEDGPEAAEQTATIINDYLKTND